eukprot:6197164-Pleurochrysis_carterae.AAC.1
MAWKQNIHGGGLEVRTRPQIITLFVSNKRKTGRAMAKTRAQMTKVRTRPQMKQVSATSLCRGRGANNMAGSGSENKKIYHSDVNAAAHQLDS